MRDHYGLNSSQILQSSFKLVLHFNPNYLIESSFYLQIHSRLYLNKTHKNINSKLKIEVFINYKIENAKISYFYSNNQEMPKHCFGLLNSDSDKKFTNKLSSPLFIEVSAKIRCAIEMHVYNRREFDVFFIQNNESAQLLKKETIFNCARDRTFYVMIKPKPNSNKSMSITLDERWGPTRRLVDATLQVGNNDSERLAPMESEKSLPLEVLESFSKAIAEPVKKPTAKTKAERFAPYSKSSNSKTTKKTSKLMEQSTLESVFIDKNTESTQSTGQSLNLLANTATQLD